MPWKEVVGNRSAAPCCQQGGEDRRFLCTVSSPVTRVELERLHWIIIGWEERGIRGSWELQIFQVFTFQQESWSDFHRHAKGFQWPTQNWRRRHSMWMSTSSLNFTLLMHAYLCWNSRTHPFIHSHMIGLCAGYHANQNSGSPSHLSNPLICLEQCACRFDWSLILSGFIFWRRLCSYFNTYHITYWTAAMYGILS